MARPRKAQREPRKSRRRILGRAQQKLNVEGKDPGFHYHWVDPKSLEEFKDSGYEVVTEDLEPGEDGKGNQSVSSAVVREGGGGKKLYLMKKRQDWYEEDIAEVQKDIDRQESFINRSAKDGTYVTKGTKISRGWLKEEE